MAPPAAPVCARGHAHARAVGGRNAPLTRAQGGKLSAVTIEETGREELVFQPARVREAVRTHMVAQGKGTPCSTAGARAMLGGAAARGTKTSDPHPDDTANPTAWIDRIYTARALHNALRRMRPKGQATGIDGWPGVLMRWAPMTVQRQYLAQLRRATAADSYPKQWPVSLVTHIPKPGKSTSRLE